MRKILILAVVTIAILTTGCPLKDKYLEVRADYIVFRETVKARCAAGEIGSAGCDFLQAADAKLIALDTKARQADASRAEIKAALEELELVMDQQRDALLGNEITP